MSKTFIILLLISNSVFAKDSENKTTKWTGSKGYLGFSSTSGNSDTDNITAGLKLKRESDKWISTLDMDILFASSDNVDTAERYILSSKTGYKFDEKNYVFYGSRYEQDKFSAFDYTMTSNVGWGHIFYNTQLKKFISEVGVGYRTQALDIDRSQSNGIAFTGKLDYMRQITPTVKFIDVLLLESTNFNTYVQNDIGVAIKVAASLNLNLVHQTKYNSTVPAGFKNADTLIAINLDFLF